MSTTMITMEISLFRNWIVEGLGSFKINGNIQDLSTDNDLDICTIALPEKYERLAKAGQPIHLLADEMEWVSFPTLEGTREMEVKFKNLGEGWLPFEHHPEIDHSQILWVVAVPEVRLEEEAREGNVSTPDLPLPGDQQTDIEVDQADSTKKNGRGKKRQPVKRAESKNKEKTEQLLLLASDSKEIQ